MIIDLQNVSYRKNGKTILDGINWQVEAGEHWIILGLNGSGKTTLLNLPLKIISSGVSFTGIFCDRELDIQPICLRKSAIGQFPN